MWRSRPRRAGPACRSSSARTGCSSCTTRTRGRSRPPSTRSCRHMGVKREDRLKPRIISSQIITGIDGHQSQLINRMRHGDMIMAGQTLYILEVYPGGVRRARRERGREGGQRAPDGGDHVRRVRPALARRLRGRDRRRRRRRRGRALAGHRPRLEELIASDASRGRRALSSTRGAPARRGAPRRAKWRPPVVRARRPPVRGRGPAAKQRGTRTERFRGAPDARGSRASRLEHLRPRSRSRSSLSLSLARARSSLSLVLSLALSLALSRRHRTGRASRPRVPGFVIRRDLSVITTTGDRATPRSSSPVATWHLADRLFLREYELAGIGVREWTSAVLESRGRRGTWVRCPVDTSGARCATSSAALSSKNQTGDLSQ